MTLRCGVRPSNVYNGWNKYINWTHNYGISSKLQLARNGAGECIEECCLYVVLDLYNVNDFSGSVLSTPRAGARLSLVRPEALQRMRIFHCCTCKSYVSVLLATSFVQHRAKKERRAVYFTEDVLVPTGIQYCTVLWTTEDVFPCRLSMCLRAGGIASSENLERWLSR